MVNKLIDIVKTCLKNKTNQFKITNKNVSGSNLIDNPEWKNSYICIR